MPRASTQSKKGTKKVKAATGPARWGNAVDLVDAPSWRRNAQMIVSIALIVVNTVATVGTIYNFVQVHAAYNAVLAQHGSLLAQQAQEQIDREFNQAPFVLPPNSENWTIDSNGYLIIDGGTFSSSTLEGDVIHLNNSPIYNPSPITEVPFNPYDIKTGGTITRTVGAIPDPDRVLTNNYGDQFIEMAMKRDALCDLVRADPDRFAQTKKRGVA